ncbi:MAG: hypothetical protein JNM22_05700 [Saprospiraceae bacterium]|nr:hypothetical protein [Saprospiraceae bacterium]
MATEQIQHIQKFIGEEGQKWAAEFIAFRRSWLASKKIDASGELSSSLQSEINDQVQGEVVEILMEFADHGRYIDMRRLKPAAGGGEYLNMLIEWMQRKGLEQRFIAGFVRRHNLNKAPQDVLNRAAWGIIKKRSLGRPRRRTWYNKPKSRGITDLFNRVAAGLLDITATDLVDQLKSK